MIAICALSALGLAACGGSSNDNSTTSAAPAPAPAPATTGGGGTAGGASTVDISTPSGTDLAFDQKDVSAKAGQVTIDFKNNQSIPHDVKVQDSTGKEIGGTDLITNGSGNATVDLQPGTYTFFCDVPGHKEAGMEGTLTVK